MPAPEPALPSPAAAPTATVSRLDRLAPAGFAVLTFALHAACGGRYGLFRDELYFLACGQRLAAGYVDQPPGIAVVARLSEALFGTWVPGLRLLPWLSSAATVWLVGRLAVRLGGGGRGALLASAAAFATPVLLALGHMLTMNAFEPMLLVALAFLLVRLAQGEDGQLWVAAGGVAGLAVLFKYTAGLVLAGFVVGLLLTRARSLLSWDALLGAAVALAVVLGNLTWQAVHGFPFLELVARGQQVKNAPITPLGFFGGMAMEVGPLNLLVWVAGLGWLLLARRARPYRFLGIGSVLYLAALVVTHGKSYYAGAVIPVLLAAGGAAWASWLRRPWAVGVSAALLALAVVPGLPMAIPILPEPEFIRYQARIGVKPPPMERDAPGILPQVYADMHGWPALVQAVAVAADRLTPEERARALVYGSNYGVAAAVDVLGRPLNLPPAISGHNTYFLWGVPPGRGDPLIVIGREQEDCGHVYREAIRVTRVPHDPWARPGDDGHTIWICRGLTDPGAVQALWPRLRHYD